MVAAPPPWLLLPGHGPKKERALSPQAAALSPQAAASRAAPASASTITTADSGAASREGEGAQALLRREEQALLREADKLARAICRRRPDAAAAERAERIDRAFSFLLLENNPEAAIALLQEAMALDPDDAAPRHGLAIAQLAIQSCR